MLNETQVYIAIKSYLIRKGWFILGGQPPSGTDNLPVIEIRDSNYFGRGSKGSYKPDLIAWFEFKLFIIELKPTFSRSDQEKVIRVLNSPERVESLWESLIQRKVEIGNLGLLSELGSETKIVGGLGYGGKRISHPDLWRFFVEEDNVEVVPGSLSAGLQRQA